MALRLVSRDQWGARNAKHNFPLSHPVPNVVCTLTRTQPCFTLQSCKHFVKRFQKYHQAVKKRLDIPYNFLVGYDGTVYEGRGWYYYTEVKYFLPKGNNVHEGIHIALIGDFKESVPAPEVMYKAMMLLIKFGIHRGFISPNYEMHLA